jgi:UDP-glucose 4-epimerase
MRALVFGGSGFLGSHTADALSESGYDVTVFDLYESSFIRKNQEMIVGNILDEDEVIEAVKRSHYVYNFAGIADIDEASEKPLETVRNNIIGNSIILEACRKYKVKRYVFASTIYVYSKRGSFYRASKQACEVIIEEYQKKYELPYTILRYGSLFGPRAPKTNWIHKIIIEALNEGKITRHGDGEEIREYIHVMDAAELSVQILSEEYENNTFIITGNNPMKIKDLHSMVKEIFDNKIELEYLKADSNNHYEITPYSYHPKIAKKLIKNQFYDLGQGILECISDIDEEKLIVES